MNKQVLFLAASVVCVFTSLKTVSADDKDVAAVVGDKTFYVSDLKAIHESNAQLQMVPFDAIYDKLLDHLIDGYLLTSKAKEEGLEKSDEVKEGMKEAEDQILRRVYLKNKIEAKMTPKELDKLYKKFVAENPSKEQVHARHILVETEEEANQALADLKGGAKFEDLAKEKSTGPSAMRGGDLGFFTKDAMVPEFADAAFALKVGEISKKPVKSQFGWHIIKVEDRRTPPPPTIKEVEPQLKAEFAEKMIESVIKDLRKGQKIKKFELKEKKADKKADEKPAKETKK